MLTESFKQVLFVALGSMFWGYSNLHQSDFYRAGKVVMEIYAKGFLFYGIYFNEFFGRMISFNNLHYIFVNAKLRSHIKMTNKML